jgi:hypothetical protein
MDAQVYPIADILKPERRFVIPTVRRDYEGTSDGRQPHFLGATMCNSLPFPAGGVAVQAVIDGPDAKTECARKFFASLNEKHEQDVKQEAVADYSELMQLAAGG